MKFLMTILLLLVLFMFQGCSTEGGTHSAKKESRTVAAAQDYPKVNEDGAVLFNWKNMLPAYIHFTRNFDYDAHVERYMTSIHPDVCKQVKNDEFAFNKAKQTSVREMQTLSSEHDPFTLYVVKKKVYFGDYDFERKRFPLVNQQKSGAEMSLDKEMLSTNLGDTINLLIMNVKPFPDRFRVSFSRATPNLPVAGIPMSEDKAKQLIQSRKEKSGYVNRMATAVIKFHIMGKQMLSEENHFRGMIADLHYEL